MSKGQLIVDVTKTHLETINITEAEGTLLFWLAQSPALNLTEHTSVSILEETA
jgi:bifunctional pyridoxal-dependent enzyme with beta-cystathionase and maltose regulon repressor activities